MQREGARSYGPAMDTHHDTPGNDRPVTFSSTTRARESVTEDSADRGGSSRRRLLLAGAAGALAGAVVGGSRPVLALQGGGDQGALIMGSNDIFKNTNPQYTNSANVASVATVIKASPNYTNYMYVAGQYVFRADASPAGGTSAINGLEGIGQGYSGAGVRGSNPSGYGVVASGTYGIYATGTSGAGVTGAASTGTGVEGYSNGGLGGMFTGGRAAIRLSPTTAAGAPTTGGHSRGELIVDSAGVLWLCKTDGTPGTWVRVSEVAASGGATGPQFKVLPTPERFIDTRSALGGVQGPVPAGTTSTFQMTGRNGESGNAALQIPDAATILVGNLSVIGSAGAPVGSFVTMWPTGDRPTTSSISFGSGAVVANAYTVGLAPVDGHGTLKVFAQQTCDYIVDVVGYYV